MEAQKNELKERYVGKSEEVFLTQFAFDLKVEDLKTATNPSLVAKKFTVHIYSNDSKTIAETAKTIYDDAVRTFTQ
jgi:hypothetical protein